MLKDMKLASVVGGVALAVVGSATWDFVAKPILLAVYEVILLVGTLGLESVRDGIYEDIGLQRNELQNLVAFLMTGLFGGYVVANILAPSIILSRKSQVVTEHNIVVDYKLNLMMKFNLITGVFIVFSSLFLFARSMYISEMQVRIDRYQGIISPFISEDQRLKFASRISLIQSRAEFIPVFYEIRDLAITHGLRPNRDPFIL